MPIIVSILSSLISFLCYFFAARSYKVPELISFSLIILIESCIYIGLIPSNKNYDKFFAVSDVFSVITDQNIKPIFYTNENFYLKANKYKEAVEKGNIASMSTIVSQISFLQLPLPPDSALRFCPKA